jgi:hypothetical protein
VTSSVTQEPKRRGIGTHGGAGGVWGLGQEVCEEWWTPAPEMWDTGHMAGLKYWVTSQSE